MGTGMGTQLRGNATVAERAKYVADEFHRRLSAEDRDLLEVVVKKQLQAAVEQDSDEDELEELKNNAYKLGEHSGLNEAAGILLTKAAQAFQNEKDAEAKQLRDIGKEFKELAEKRHPRFGKELTDH
jgi:hypothetical protein